MGPPEITRPPRTVSDDGTGRANNKCAGSHISTGDAWPHPEHNKTQRKQDGSGHTLFCMDSSAEKAGFFSSLSRSDVAMNRKSRSSDSNWASHDVGVEWDIATVPSEPQQAPKTTPANADRPQG